MLVSLIRAMKPKILESFEDYNAQKEFLAKINKNKKITVVLNHGEIKDNLLDLKKQYNLISLNQNDKKIIVYNIYKHKKNIV